MVISGDCPRGAHGVVKLKAWNEATRSDRTQIAVALGWLPPALNIARSDHGWRHWRTNSWRLRFVVRQVVSFAGYVEWVAEQKI